MSESFSRNICVQTNIEYKINSVKIKSGGMKNLDGKKCYETSLTLVKGTGYWIAILCEGFLWTKYIQSYYKSKNWFRQFRKKIDFVTKVKLQPF